jgi:hypothetical protein
VIGADEEGGCGRIGCSAKMQRDRGVGQEERRE